MSKNKILKIFCDGGSRNNPGPAACAFLVYDENNKLLKKSAKYLGKTTNNIAEYTAVIEALKWLKSTSSQLPDTSYFFYLDSKLVVNQLNGIFKIKSGHLRPLIIKIKQSEREINLPIYYHLIPRSQNKQADSLVNQVLNTH